MLKSSRESISRNVRIAPYALAALALVTACAPVAARADSITQSLIHTANGASGIQANFLPFNSALGTLQSLDVQLKGKSTILEQESFPYTITITLDDPF